VVTSNLRTLDDFARTRIAELAGLKKTEDTDPQKRTPESYDRGIDGCCGYLYNN